MKFNELGENLRKCLSRKLFHEQKYKEETTQLSEKFKGDFLNTQLAERKSTRDSALYALQSSLKADIKAVRDEKIKLAETAATKAPSQETMMLLQALSMRKSVPKSEILAIFEAIQGNYHAMAVLRDIAEDKGFRIDIDDIEQTKKRINDVCDLAENAVEGNLDALTLAALGDRDYKIAQYNEAEKKRDVLLMTQIDDQIKSGFDAWDNATAGLDSGFASDPVITRIITPGEKEIIKRMFAGVPADELKNKVNDKAAESPKMREMIELSDFASLLEVEGK